MRPWPPRIRPSSAELDSASRPTVSPSSNPGRCHGTHATSSPKTVRVRPLAVPRGGNRDHRIRVHVIDMTMREEAVERGIDARRARVQVERAMPEIRRHLVFVLAAAIDRAEAVEPVEIQRGEAIELCRTQVAARAFHPENLDGFPGQRIGGGDLCRRVSTAEVRDAQVGSEEVGTIAQQLGLGEARGMGLIPAIDRAGRGEHPGRRVRCVGHDGLLGSGR